MIEKRYYKIGDLSLIAKVETSTIRFWENEFNWIRPKYTTPKNRVFPRPKGVKPNEVGHRKYSPCDAQKVLDIKYLIKDCGMSLQGVRMAEEQGYLSKLIEFFPIDVTSKL